MSNEMIPDDVMEMLPEFLQESEEHLQVLNEKMLEAEKAVTNGATMSQENLNTMFRSAHTIKGTASFIGLKKVVALTHKAGGLLHIMMPAAGDAATRPDCKKAKYADTGVPEIIRAMKLAYGVQPQDLIAKMFGGAKILKEVERNIGQENGLAVQAMLKEYGIPIRVNKVGGDRGYRIRIMTDTAKVMCQVFGNPPEEF